MPYATIQFTPPDNTGGLPITEYTVTSYPDNITSVGTQSPIIISGLDNDIEYTFTVHATNEVGDSFESIPSNAIMSTTIYVDPFYPAVILLINGDGANGEINVTDSSLLTREITTVGNAQISTVQSKFGNSSLVNVNRGKAFYDYYSQAFVMTS